MAPWGHMGRPTPTAGAPRRGQRRGGRVGDGTTAAALGSTSGPYGVWAKANDREPQLVRLGGGSRIKVPTAAEHEQRESRKSSASGMLRMRRLHTRGAIATRQT